MKKLILFLTVFSFSCSIKAQSPILPDITVYTPNWSPVNAKRYNEDRSPATRLVMDNDYKTYSGVIQVKTDYSGCDGISSTYKFNCHSYTWLRTDNQIIDCWMEPYSSNVYAFMSDGSYIQVPHAIGGARVFWDNGNHSAIIPGNDTLIYESKQSEGPLVRHWWYYPNSGSRKYYVKPSSLAIEGPDYINKATTYKLDISPGQINYWSFINSNGFTGASGNNTTVTIIPPNPISGQITTLYVRLNNGYDIKKTITTIALEGSDAICIGKQATYTVVGVTGSYSWVKSANLSGSSSSSSITVTASTTPGPAFVGVVAGGDTVAKKDITISSLPASRTISGNGYFFFENGFGSDVYNLTPLNGGGSILWSISPTTGVSLWNHLNPNMDYVTVYSYGVADTYTLKATITNANGCTIDVFKYIQIRDGNRGPAIVYPIPADQILYIDLDQAGQSPASNNQVFDVRLYDIQGNLVNRTTTRGGIVQFDVSNLPNGIYVVHIYDGISKNPLIYKIIIEH